MLKNQRGMIGIAPVILAMILSVIISMVVLNFTYQAGSLAIKQENNFRDYQGAAFGAARGIWLLKQNAWMAGRTFPYPAAGYETVPGSGSNVRMNIIFSAAASNYTITSISGNKTLIAVINNNKIISWD